MNPILTFLNPLKSDIMSTRDALFSELKNVNPETERFARSVLEQKEKKERLPSLGEIFPWFLCDLLQLDKNSLQRSNVGWLGFYIYTIYIDNLLDDNYSPRPDEILSSSILQGLALRNLSSVVINTPYENNFYEYLYSAVNSEYKEVEIKSKINNLAAKEEVSIGKNRILLAYASSLAAINISRSDEILEITNSILVSLQYLDDIADFEDDFITENYSYLLSWMLQSNPSFLKNLENSPSLIRAQVLRELLTSNALAIVLSKIANNLNLTVGIINKSTTISYKSEALKFVEELISNIGEFNEYLNQIDDSFIDEQILDKVEHHIKIIAQSS